MTTKVIQATALFAVVIRAFALNALIAKAQARSTTEIELRRSLMSQRGYLWIS